MENLESKIDELKAKLANNDVYIWGTRTYGLSVLKKLQGWNIFPKGFVDSVAFQGHIIQGLPVLLPDEIYNKSNVFIVIATAGFSDTIKNLCIQNEMKNFFSWQDFTHASYYIEMNNKCNLSCSTCSVKNYRNDHFHEMPMDTFHKVIEKILHEDPFVTHVFLYGQNEPLLSKDLPIAVKFCKNKNLSVGISTNLNISYDFYSLVKSQIDWIRVSVSGCTGNYEKYHVGGKFIRVLANLQTLSELRSQLNPNLEIELVFHKYKDNLDDEQKLRQICSEYGISFRTFNASVIGLEAVLNVLEGRPVPQRMLRTLPFLRYSVQETAKSAFKNKNLPCLNEKLVMIHSKCSVSTCQCWQGSELPEVHFLKFSLIDILSKIKSSHLCAMCKPRGLHQFFTDVFDEELQANK